MGRTSKRQTRPEFGGGNALQAVYPDCSAARLYAAAVRTVMQLGFPITARDDARMIVTFHPHGPTASWPVDEMTAVIHPKGDAAQVLIGGAPTVGYRMEMIDWNQAQRVSLMFLQRLASVFPHVPESEPNVPSGRSVTEQLQSLADLRDQGLLTEDEFTQAKKLLLG